MRTIVRVPLPGNAVHAAGVNILPLVGANIRRFRHAAGLSQEELAHRARIDRSYVSGLERGVRNPSVLILQDLAAVLGIHAADLLTAHEPQRRRSGRSRGSAAGTKKAP